MTHLLIISARLQRAFGAVTEMQGARFEPSRSRCDKKAVAGIKETSGKSTIGDKKTLALELLVGVVAFQGTKGSSQPLMAESKSLEEAKLFHALFSVA